MPSQTETSIKPPLEEILPLIWAPTLKAHIDIDWYLNDLERLVLEYHMRPSRVGVIDVAAGIGFPSHWLTEKGRWFIHVNEPDENMRRIGRSDLPWDIRSNPPGYSAPGRYDTTYRWQDFPTHMLPSQQGRYEVVLCLGNSLPYAGGWGIETVDIEQAQTEIEKSVAGFSWLLQPGGILVVTKHRDDFPDAEGTCGIGVYGKLGYEHEELFEKYDFKTEVWNNPKTRIRHWMIALKREQGEESATEQRFVYDVQSYALRDEELQSMLEQAGFRDIQRRDILGDQKGYATFVARKA